MKIFKCLLIVAAVSGPFALKFGGEAYQARLCRNEGLRMHAIEILISTKLEEYERAHGRYPDSLDALSFTSTPAEREAFAAMPKFSYHANDRGGYILGYHGEGVSFFSSSV